MIYKCIHCLAETDRTKDHIFPKQWYPDNTPGDVQRPTAPACAPCNNALGKLEVRLFRKLAMCIDHTKPEVSGIQKKLFADLGIGIDMRLLKPAKINEIRIRQANARKLLADSEPYREGMIAFPGLGPRPGFPMEGLRSIPVPEAELKPVCEKIMRGLEYAYKERYVEKPYRLEIQFVDEDADIANVEKMFATRLPDTIGPGFKVERLHADEDPNTVLYRVIVWGTLTIYGCILPDTIPRRERGSYGDSLETH